jgi:uncharacterized phage protein (predicted DNA packaging)
VKVLAVSLEEAKLYLRITSDENGESVEDALITSLLETARHLCEGVLRMSFDEFEEMPKTVDQAVLYITANLYEHRENLDMKIVEDVVKRLLLPHRRESW